MRAITTLGLLCGLFLVSGCEPAAKAPEKLAEVALNEAASALPAGDTKTAAEAQVVAENPATTPALEEPSADGHNRLTPDEISEGWLRLFDGSTLFGWKPNSSAAWTVAEGEIRTDGSAGGLLVTTTPFANYELRCDYQLADGGNSGVFLRTPFEPTNPAVDCYELNMCDSRPEYGTGSLVARQEPEGAPIVAGPGWHSWHVVVDGPRVTAQLDGKPVLDYTDATESPLKSGFIGLQVREGSVAFRNVFLKPLGMKPLFDGESLTGWRVVPGSQSEFNVVDETIHVTGGRGFLETEETAGDFVFQFEAITHGDTLNSGVFFRAIPGTEANPSDGYEFQIQHGFKDGDRTKPADFGTGAIFRRVAARRVVANDREWFTGTLIANGPHFATWVNGIQVVDWTDDRPADANPRQGLRVEPGHFSLQGHDPGTNLSFRNLRLGQLP